MYEELTAKQLSRYMKALQTLAENTAEIDRLRDRIPGLLKEIDSAKEAYLAAKNYQCTDSRGHDFHEMNYNHGRVVESEYHYYHKIEIK